MHFKSTLTIIFALFFSLVSSGPIAIRDANTVKTDLAKISTDLNTLTAAVNSYTGGLTAALNIQVKETAVENDIDQAITDTNAAATFTAAESSSITSALLALQPNIESSLTALVSKKSLFVAAGVGSIVRTDLNSLKTKTGSLSTALQNKATASDKASIAAGTVEINEAFDTAIAAYA